MKKIDLVEKKIYKSCAIRKVLLKNKKQVCSIAVRTRFHKKVNLFKKNMKSMLHKNTVKLTIYLALLFFF